MLPVIRYLYNSEQNILGIRTMMISNDNGNDKHDSDENDKMNVKMI